MNEKKEKIIKIVPFRDYDELDNLEWTAKKDEDIKSCIEGLMRCNANAIQVGEKKMFSLMGLTEIKEQHGNIILKEFMNLKFCKDCGNWKNYENFYKRKVTYKGVVKMSYYTYCRECYNIRNKRYHPKWYGKAKNKKYKSIYGKAYREKNTEYY